LNPGVAIIVVVTVETFRPELLEAMRAYDRYDICIDKFPKNLKPHLISLLHKAIRLTKAAGNKLRHGIALDQTCHGHLSQEWIRRAHCAGFISISIRLTRGNRCPKT